MKYEIEKNDLYYILTPKDEKIDSVVAPTLKADLITYEVEGAKNIILDLKNVKFMDSSGLSAMLVGNRTFQEKQASFIICNVNKHIEKILKTLSLFDKRDEQIFGLSGGMKRRLLIAKALAHEPKILFLDEPTAGVDVSLRRDIWKLIEDQKKMGVTIILTTHYIEEAEQLADRVGIINSGEIILVKEKTALMSEFSKKTTFIRLSKKLKNPSFMKKNKKISLTENGMTLKLVGINNKSNELQSIVNLLSQNGIAFTEINTVDNSLEDIFLDLVETQ